MTMHATGAFTLHIDRAENHEPVRVSVAFTGAIAGATGILHLTPNCLTLDELEGCINALQDELDMLRADARRVLTVDAGHA